MDIDMSGLRMEGRQQLIEWYLINSEVLKLKGTFKALDYLDSLPADHYTRRLHI